MEILFSNQQIKERVKQIANIIPNNSFFLVVLDSSLPFFNDLKIELEKLKKSYNYDFIKLKSYTGKESNGNITIIQEPNKYPKKLIILEDILDTGGTLNFLINYLKENNVEDIKICTFINKKIKRDFNIIPDIIGFDIEDLFVIGYGMDHNGKYRDLDYISYLNK